MPIHFFFAHVSPVRVALCAALITGGCAHSPEPPTPPAAKPAPAARAAAPRTSEGPTTIVAVLAVHRTQQVDGGTRARCGEQIAPPPAKSLWSRMFSSAPSNEDKVMPPPEFMPEIGCDKVASQRYDLAHYRVAYRFDNEEYIVELDYDPGAAVRLDDLGRVLGPAQLP